MKKRVLFGGEASPLNTGFSTYYRELLPRLAKTGKYDIGEMGSYMQSIDPRAHEFIKNRWRFWGVEPTSQEEHAEYQNPANQSPRCPGQNTWQFGDGKFPHVCAEFKPDIVIEIRDWWMLEYIERSPFRPYFKWLAMPTVDSEPQKEEWVNTYATADLCLAYSDFGAHTLKQYPGIKVFPEPMRPGVDLQTFRPMDKVELKRDWLGCKDDVKVILMIARNQSRKLYPDALDAFALLKERYKGNPVVEKAVLVIHSSWPDNQFSYDYPRHIHRISTGYYGLEYYYPKMRDDVFQTLICHDCGHVSMTWAINLFGKPVEQRNRGPKIYVTCQKCGKQTATTPDTSTGYTREQLAQLYNVADAFIQVSIAEGCFKPGTPVLTRGGWKNIEDITHKDEVFTSDGNFHKVHKTMDTPISECVDVRVDTSAWDITCTTNHPFLTVVDSWPNNKTGLREKIGEKKPDNLDFKYIEAGDLKKGDLLVQSIPQQEILPDYGFEIDEDMAWFLGVVAADGYIRISDNNSYIKVTTSINDEALFDRVNNIAQRFGKSAKRHDYKDRAAYDVNINDKAFAELLRPLLYTPDKIKKIPDGAILWPKNLQKALLGGLLHGDGSDRGNNVWRFANTSRYIALDLDIILKRLKLFFNYHEQCRDKPRKNIYGFDINLSGNVSSTSSLYWKDYILMKVKSINFSKYNKNVINLTVHDDHTFTIPFATVHNCGMPVQEAKSCGVPTLVTNYSATAEKGRFPAEYEHLKKVKPEDYTVSKGGIAIPVGRYYYEPETSCRRAHPDVSVLADQLYQLLSDDELREKTGIEARECAEENYDWDKLAKRWEYVLDNVKIKDRSLTWDKPHKILASTNDVQIPDGLSNDALLDFLYINILKYPRVDDAGKAQWLASMQAGQSREQVIKAFKSIGNDQINRDNQVNELLAKPEEEKDELGGEFV